MTSYGSDWLDPNVSDSALSVERHQTPINVFTEWDEYDQSHYPVSSDMGELAREVEQGRKKELGKRHHYSWTRPCALWEYREDKWEPIEEYLPRDMIARHPDVDSHQSGWGRIMHMIEVDGIVGVQLEVLLVNGSCSFLADLVFDQGESVRGRRWIEQP